MTAHGVHDVTVARLAEAPSLWPASPEPGAAGISCLYIAEGSAIVGALGLYLQARELLLIEGNAPVDIDAAGVVLAVRLTPKR
jgi:hypothetical protein